MQKVPVLRVVPQSCPKMPRRKALIKTLKTKGNVHGLHLYTSVLIKEYCEYIRNLLRLEDKYAIILALV